MNVPALIVSDLTDREDRIRSGDFVLAPNAYGTDEWMRVVRVFTASVEVEDYSTNRTFVWSAYDWCQL